MFWGEIVLIIIVIAGEVQHSAKRYSKNKKVIEAAKLFWINVQAAIVGTPSKLPAL